MKLEGDYLFEAKVSEVWSALFDPVILAAVMPGCEKLELEGQSYVGEIKVKVGPIQGKFTGKVDLQDRVEPESYTMIVDGRGAPGFVKATAHIRLAAEGEATRVHYDTDAQIGGKIASVGQRLIDASARAIVAQSLEGLHANIKLRGAAYREAAAKQEASPAVAFPPASPASEAAPGETVPASGEATAPSPEAGKPTEAVPAAAEATAPSPEAGKPAEAAPAPEAAKPFAGSEAARPPEPQVAFTPVKVTQSAVANAVAKEVASTLFPRSVLVTIILLEALVIVWLLLRH
jgi:carbon monoxide dehydrogenase subunit G